MIFAVANWCLGYTMLTKNRPKMDLSVFQKNRPETKICFTDLSPLNRKNDHFVESLNRQYCKLWNGTASKLIGPYPNHTFQCPHIDLCKYAEDPWLLCKVVLTNQICIPSCMQPILPKYKTSVSVPCENYVVQVSISLV